MDFDDFASPPWRFPTNPAARLSVLPAIYLDLTTSRLNPDGFINHKILAVAVEHVVSLAPY